jgi:hypothetical protein
MDDKFFHASCTDLQIRPERQQSKKNEELLANKFFKYQIIEEVLANNFFKYQIISLA